MRSSERTAVALVRLKAHATKYPSHNKRTMPDGIFWAIIPITFLMIPIVAILTRHQQKMAEIMHRGDAGLNSSAHEQIAKLQQEMSELKTLVHSQAILLDTISSGQKSLNAPPPTPSIPERLSS
jgi:hypothetical protein